MPQKTPAQSKYFGMTLGQLLILALLSFIACLLFIIILLMVRSNTSIPVQSTPLPTKRHALVQPTKVIEPTAVLRPTITPQAEMLSGPAMRYIPINTDGMPAGYRNGNVEDYALDDGEYYKVKFVLVDSSGVNMESPQIFFSSYVGNTIKDAEEKQLKTKLEFDSKADWSYTWSDSRLSSSHVNNAIEYVGYHSYGQYAEVGRLLQTRNVSVLITVSVQNKNGISNADIAELQQELDRLTEMVVDKFGG